MNYLVCKSVLTPKSLVEGNAYEARGLQPLLYPLGVRTPNWPAQPATRPRDPMPGPLQASVTLKPDGSLGKKEPWGKGSEHQELLNYK